jgi:hypothetical protein
MLQTEQPNDAAVEAAEGCCRQSSRRMLRWKQRKDAAVEAAEGRCSQGCGAVKRGGTAVLPNDADAVQPWRRKLGS